MQVATNYIWVDVRHRAALGMRGGEALSGLHVPGDDIEVAVCDESNAFTSVLTPAWMHGWCAAPPIRAALVWSRLPQSLRQRINMATFIFPLYMRLAMGSSHSVFILMAINMALIGRSLLASRRMGGLGNAGTGADVICRTPGADGV